MIAIALDPAMAAVAVAGRGPEALRRFVALQANGLHRPLLYCDRPDDVGDVPVEALRTRLPDPSDLAGLRALWIAGLPDDEAASLSALARSARVLVNVEDRP